MTVSNEDLRLQLDGLSDRQEINHRSLVRHFRVLMETIMAHLEELKAEVAKNREVTASAILLLDGLAEKIEQYKNDPVELQKLADDLRTDHQGLGDAVARNTPVDPNPVEPEA